MFWKDSKFIFMPKITRIATFLKDKKNQGTSIGPLKLFVS